jgi:hypothetical protein
MDSDRDPELGHESIVKDYIPKSQRGGSRYSATLNEPLLRDTLISGRSGDSFADNEDTLHAISDNIEESVPEDVYATLSSDQPYVVELKTEVRRLLSCLWLYREWMLADDEIRRRMSRGVTLVSAYHLAFMIAMCVAVYGGHVDGKPWSVAFWLMLVELAVLLTVLAVKLVAMYKYENRKQPETLSLKLNFQNMPTVRKHLGEQQFKDYTELLQKQFDRICACLVEESVEPSYCDVVKFYFKR